MTPSNELYHFGIKGQKWGIRRFQNKSGGLTSAGRKHYDDNESGNSSGQSFKQKMYRSAPYFRSRAKKIATSRKFKIGAGIAAGAAVSTAAAFVIAHNCKKKSMAEIAKLSAKRGEEIRKNAQKGLEYMQAAMAKQNAAVNNAEGHLGNAVGAIHNAHKRSASWFND